MKEQSPTHHHGKQCPHKHERSRSGYWGDGAHYSHTTRPRIGILLSNLGTPDEPTPKALRRYLREFLWDPRVIEVPRPLWWLILNLAVLPFRPKKSAALYRSIWTEEGSPLLVNSVKQLEGFKARLQEVTNQPVAVELGMRYGNPSIEHALNNLRRQMIDRLIVLPLYPQYSATTGGSTFDAVSDVLKRWRWVPSLHMVMNFADHPGYIAAVAESIREAWRERGKPRRLLYSFHGIPKQYLLDGDPYHCLCHKTARLVSESLGLQREEYDVCFQSLFGKDEWLRPYTSERLEELGKEKLESIHVVCPGFSADCLETIEEIGEENREVFQHAGGGEYHYIPALNGRPDFCDSLVQLVLDSCPQWFARQEAPTAGAECQARYEVEAKRVEAYTPKGK